VRTRYDSTADIYDRRYQEEQEAKYSSALAGVDIGGSFLDVGCGTGLFFKYVSAKATNVVGIDISKALLLRAKESAKADGNIDLIQADADNLPFKDRDFDVVFAFTVLQNMPEPLVTLKEIKRTAKSGATVIVTGLKKIFSIPTLRKLVEEAGLRIVFTIDDEKLACNVLRAQREQ
jgi:demethylmenaquinone methyltransferase/2-methoxy-6-polyprenyl-1,4-benzoquinol methylase